MEPITTTAAVIYIADKILGSYIEETWNRPFWYFLFPPKKYKSKLVEIITETINEFEATRGTKKSSAYFYHYREVTDKLIDRIIFHKSTFSVASSFKANDEIDIPSDEDLQMFFDLLIHKINRCSILKKLYVEEHYKHEIFSIGNDLKDLKEDLKEVVKGLGSSVLEEYQHELDQIKRNIEDFKPKTAHDTLIELEKRISSRGNSNSNISSRISYLKALCLSELNNFDAASKCSIEAYRIDSTNVEYRERAAVAYLNLGYKDEAFNLATNIISNQNPLNERANAILFIKGLEEGEDFHTSYKEMKELIKEGTRFKIAVSNYLIKQGKQELIFALFHKELINIKPTEKIIYTNKDFWSIYSQVLMQKALSEDRNNFLDFVNPALKKNPYLIAAHKSLNHFINALSDTEKFSTIGFHRYLLFFADYLITNEKSALEGMISMYREMKNKERQHYIIQVVFSLTQSGRIDDALREINDFADQVPLQALMIKTLLLARKNRLEEARIASEQAIKLVKKFDDLNVEFLFLHFDLVENFNSKKQLYEELINEGKVEKEIEPILYNFFLEVEIEKAINKLIEIAANLPEEFQISRRYIAAFLRTRSRFQEAANILETVIDFDIETPDLGFYIECLVFSRANLIKSLQLLKKWRNSFTPKERFYIWELNILSDIPDYNTIDEVSEQAKRIFPDNPYFNYFKILASFNLKHENIEELLREVEFDKLSLNQALHVASIAIRSGALEVGFEIMYFFAKSKENIIAREKFFATFGLAYDKYKKNARKDETINLEQNVLLLVNESKEQVVRLTKENRLAKELVGKKVGDEVYIKDTHTLQDHKVKVVSLLDKFEVLFYELRKELEETPAIDSSFKSIKLSDSTIEALEKTLVENFGFSGSERKSFVRGELEKYKKGEIGFSAITRNVFNDRPIDAYLNLTNDNSLVYRTIPKKFFEVFNTTLNNESEFVLDFPSLLFFIDLEEQKGIHFSHKFFISQLLIDHFEDELFETEFNPPTTLSVSITLEGIMPHFYAESMKENRIKYFKKLLNWIDNNCKAIPVIDKIDILSQLKKEEPESRGWYLEYLLDTAFLANKPNRYLISDDKEFFDLLKNFRCIVSAEYYLSRFSESEYDPKINAFLIEKNCLGVQVSYEPLKFEFENNLGTSNQGFLKAVRNLSPEISLNQHAPEIALDFIKYIYLSDIPLTEKKRISVDVFVSAFKGISQNLVLRLSDTFNKIIEGKFFLLQPQMDNIKDDFRTALNILVINFLICTLLHLFRV